MNTEGYPLGYPMIALFVAQVVCLVKSLHKWTIEYAKNHQSKKMAEHKNCRKKMQNLESNNDQKNDKQEKNG